MWRCVIFVYSAVSLTAAQNGRTSAHQDHGHGWDIRLAVPGEPGSDYPTLGTIPRTSFSCSGKTPGYYADLETDCQVFRVCTLGSTYGFQSFLCPNGTLFNQAVFVCDWWMNVNCQQSQRLLNNNNEQFGNLRLGPQLMKDINKMLTHPMRNPYDRNAMKNNQIVMQDYRAPYGQPFGALTAGPERPSNVYVPAKQIQPPAYDTNDIAFAASTLSPRYVPAAFNTIRPSTQRDAEVFQRQRQYVQTNRQQSAQFRQQNAFSNDRTGQFTQSNHNFNNQQTRPTQSYNTGNTQYGRRLVGNTTPTQAISTQNILNVRRGQLNQQPQYNNQRPSKQTEYHTGYTKQQYNANYEKQPYTYPQPQVPLSNIKSGKLVSATDDIPSTVITKTVTLKRVIQDSKLGTPKSRITVKTWIVKPSKSAKLVEPTPYTYQKPTQPQSQKLIDTTPYSYVYNKPSTEAQKLISESDEPYVYNKPTVAAKQIVTTSKQPARILSTVTTPRPTLSRLYLPPTSIPTQSSRLYLPPTTYNPSSRLYLPPSSAPIVSRQYLTPTVGQQSTDYRSGQLRASPTTPYPLYALPDKTESESSPYSRLKQSNEINNRNNITFTDVLTKKRLDNTVNSIVKDTSQILKTASPMQFEQFRDVNSVDYPDDTYLPPQTSTDSGESLTSLLPTAVSTSARLVASPSVDLEPPVETHSRNQNTNQISNLPFYKESVTPTNTIERTVSLKISIPEKIAGYLFKSQNDSDYDKLEILNTGSSNYLVLTNNYRKKQSGMNFIPIGKLISDKKPNISDSQALVFSLLADSINIAKEYNLAQQGAVHSTPAQADTEEIEQITDMVSQLTSAQFSGSNKSNFKSANIIATPAPTNNKPGYQYNSPPTNHLLQSQYKTNQNRGPNADIQTNSKQIYSGQLYQLPVPEVTNRIYNRPSTSNQIQSNNNQNTDENISINSNDVENKAIESVNSNTKPLGKAAKLEVAPTSELDHFSEETFRKFIKSNNGISAQLQDKIVGTIPHPLEDNKVVTYKKDESYYVYTKLDNDIAHDIQNAGNIQSNEKSAKIIQGNNLPNIVAFQLIPSVSYELEDEKEQQKILNAFQLDEFGNPKQKANLIDESNQPGLTSHVDYSIDHHNQNEVGTLYAGPSSYSAPQGSVGRLDTRQDQSSRLELEDNSSSGYPRVSPSPEFSF